MIKTCQDSILCCHYILPPLANTRRYSLALCSEFASLNSSREVVLAAPVATNSHHLVCTLVSACIYSRFCEGRRGGAVFSGCLTFLVLVPEQLEEWIFSLSFPLSQRGHFLCFETCLRNHIEIWKKPSPKRHPYL